MKKLLFDDRYLTWEIPHELNLIITFILDRKAKGMPNIGK